MAKSYSGLIRSRMVVAALTLGLLAVIFGVMIDLILTGQRTTIPLPTQKLIAPLNPQLDISVLERLENYEFVSFEQARAGVRSSNPESGSVLESVLPAQSEQAEQPELLPTQSETPNTEPANQ